jgi:hypothetical protein
MAMIGRLTGWENTTHATLALSAADTLQGLVIQDDWSILASQDVPMVTASTPGFPSTPLAPRRKP